MILTWRLMQTAQPQNRDTPIRRFRQLHFDTDASPSHSILLCFLSAIVQESFQTHLQSLYTS